MISEPVDLALNKPAPDMWDHVLKTFKQTLEKAETTYLTKAKSKWTRRVLTVSFFRCVHRFQLHGGGERDGACCAAEAGMAGAAGQGGRADGRYCPPGQVARAL